MDGPYEKTSTSLFKNPSSHPKICCIVDCFFFTSVSSKTETSRARSTFISTIFFQSEVEAVATSLARYGMVLLKSDVPLSCCAIMRAKWAWKSSGFSELTL